MAAGSVHAIMEAQLKKDLLFAYTELDKDLEACVPK